MATYAAINPTTVATLLAGNANVKQQLWMMQIHWESRGRNPFAVLTGGAGHKFGGKPVMEIADTQRVKGDTIQIQTTAPLGGEGVQGDTQRTGTEETIRNGGYQFTIGRVWNGIGWTSVAANQTVVGTKLDKESNRLLGEWLGWRKAQDIEVEMLINKNSYNTLYPNNKSAREALKSNDYLQGETIVRAKMTLATLMANPVKIATSKAGAPIFKYVLVGNQYSLFQWQQTASYTAILANAQEKGDTNMLFAGGLPEWNGVSLYEWTVEDHTAYGPLGAPCVPRAALGNAIPADGTLPNITGGGNATASSLLERMYFKNFSNAAYTGFEGQKRAAITNITRYVLIQNLVDSGLAAGNAANNDILKFGFYSYQVNNGNLLTMLGRLGPTITGGANTTIGNVTWNQAPWTYSTSAGVGYLTNSHAAGSLIYECNSFGVCFVQNYVMGDKAIISGYGTVDGSVCMGKRTQEIQDNERVMSVGIDSCWGCKAIPRVDGVVQGFVVIESAFAPVGSPIIS